VIYSIFSEVSPAPCDTGSPIAIITSEFPDIDFTPVSPTFPSKTKSYAYTSVAVLQRGQDMLKWLYARPEKVIAVISHASFLRIGMGKRFFVNADYRIFDFENVTDGELLKLKEWEETAKDGGYLSRPDSEFAEIKGWDFPKEKADAVKETTS
jgi:hypothetical protein